MKYFEYQGKEIFDKYELPLLPRQVLLSKKDKITLPLPLIAKAQVLATDRKRAGGILVAKTNKDLRDVLNKLFGKEVCNERIDKVLIEELVDVVAEYYISFSYDTKKRGPVMAISPRGGSGIDKAHIYPINVLDGLTARKIRAELKRIHFPNEDMATLIDITLKLWKLFNEEKVIVAEINPILKARSGKLFCGDSKIDLGKRRNIEKMDGDIAIIASGGGASLINMDALLLAGGKPANYAEYSGNPKREIVTELTREVFTRPGIKGCWVIGGTANFTDIYETMLGFTEGLKRVRPKPKFPFVIRRGGPRTAEAIEMLKKFAQKEGFEFYIYGSETPMVKTAKYIVDLAYKGIKPPKG